MTIWIIIFSSVVVLFIYALYHRKVINRRDIEIPESWKEILSQKVDFYQHLSDSEKERFEQNCYLFLRKVTVTGIETDVSLEDRLLVASSAIIPLFGFPEWEYPGLKEVILYPSAFDRNFQFNNEEEVITGMVGNGIMQGKVIFSKPALHHGFANTQDKKNVGIHEFVHLFDDGDGIINGIPNGFEDKKYAVLWVKLMKSEIQKIKEHHSDINIYGSTSQEEFFAVVSEYFFERPILFKKKHPELYDLLKQIFHQKLAKKFKLIPSRKTSKKRKPSRNEKCVCGSGKKYKYCCMS